MDLAALTWLAKGLFLGFAIAAPVGPIGVLCIRRTLAEGWLTGFLTGMGAATADGLYGGVAAFGLTAISGTLVAQQGVIRVVGGALLCYLGLRTLLAKPALEAASARRGRGLAGRVCLDRWPDADQSRHHRLIRDRLRRAGTRGRIRERGRGARTADGGRVSRLGVLVAAAQRRSEPVAHPADGRRAALGESGVGHPAAGLRRGGGGQRRHGALMLLPACQRPLHGHPHPFDVRDYPIMRAWRDCYRLVIATPI